MQRRTFLALAAAAALVDPARANARASALSLDPGQFRTVRTGIAGIEGIAAAPDGGILVSTEDAACGLLSPDGTLRLIGPAVATGGVAFDPHGRAILASVGALHGKPGPLRRADLATGTVETLASAIAGRELVASNSPVVSRDGIVYCSHSGWSVGNIGTTAAEGFIFAVWPDGRVEKVAEGLRGANGLALGPDDRTLLCCVTAEGRVREWRRHRDGTLGRATWHGPALGSVVPDQTAKELFAAAPDQRARTGYCDGMAFDMRGNLYVTLPFANRIVAVTRSGRVVDVVHDPDGRFVDFPTNIAFAGRDRRTLLVVSRGSNRIVAAQVPYPGLPLANWPRA